MRDIITEIAKKHDADVITFTPASQFPKDDAIFKIFPEVKTVIALGFRVLRGAYRGVEEGTVYYQYTTMGVENIEETVMPMAMLRVASVIEQNGFCAIPQKRNQLIMNEANSTNPEVDYSAIFRNIDAENQMNFEKSAEICGLGEIGMSGKIINKEFGPYFRYCFVLTDAETEPTPKEKISLCDRCGECIKACPGNAITDTGLDPWRCAVYYSCGTGEKNPFMAPDAFLNFENRKEIIDGTASFDAEGAKKILDSGLFYPPAGHSYKTSLCARACDRACYIHLEEKGVLTRKFKKKFRERDDWKLDTKQFDTLKREKEWNFTAVEKRK